MASIHITSASATATGPGMGGIESPLGRLGVRVFKACKGTVTRAARSLSRTLDRLVHTRLRHPPLVRAHTNSAPRASLRKLDFSVVDPGRSQGLQPSPGAVSSQSMPNCVLHGRPGTPTYSVLPIEGVRLKPGRSAGDLQKTVVRDDRPPLPPRPPGLNREWSYRSRSGTRPAPAPAPAPASAPVSPSASAPASAISAASRDAAAPDVGCDAGNPTAGGTPAPTLVFHRKSLEGPPITARVDGAGAPPKSPGTDEPPR